MGGSPPFVWFRNCIWGSARREAALLSRVGRTVTSLGPKTRHQPPARGRILRLCFDYGWWLLSTLQTAGAQPCAGHQPPAPRHPVSPSPHCRHHTPISQLISHLYRNQDVLGLTLRASLSLLAPLAPCTAQLRAHRPSLTPATPGRASSFRTQCAPSRGRAASGCARTQAEPACPAP